MGIAEYLILFLLLLLIINIIFQAIYCRFERYMESKINAKEGMNSHLDAGGENNTLKTVKKSIMFLMYFRDQR